MRCSMRILLRRAEYSALSKAATAVKGVPKAYGPFGRSPERSRVTAPHGEWGWKARIAVSRYLALTLVLIACQVLQVCDDGEKKSQQSLEPITP